MGGRGVAQELPVRGSPDLDVPGVVRQGRVLEILVEELVSACRNRYEVTIEDVTVAREDVRFNLPRTLTG